LAIQKGKFGEKVINKNLFITAILPAQSVQTVSKNAPNRSGHLYSISHLVLFLLKPLSKSVRCEGTLYFNTKVIFGKKSKKKFKKNFNELIMRKIEELKKVFFETNP